jgi:hypothetical protein
MELKSNFLVFLKTVHRKWYVGAVWNNKFVFLVISFMGNEV